MPAGSARLGAAGPVALDEFSIDKYEVTNREYKAFVDDGGYRDDRLWAAGIDRGATWTEDVLQQSHVDHPEYAPPWLPAAAFRISVSVSSIAPREGGNT